MPTPAIPLAKAAAAARYYRRRGEPGDAERAEGLEAGLAAAHRCRECGRRITDPVSVAAGVGPDCRAKAARCPDG
jgi:hypothetical protein